MMRNKFGIILVKFQLIKIRFTLLICYFAQNLYLDDFTPLNIVSYPFCC